MNDAKLMKVFNACYDLMEEFASLCLFDSLVLHDVVKELASTCILHDQVELLGCLDNFIKLNNMRMTNEFEDVNLSGDPFNITDILYFLLLKYFDSDLLARQIVIPELDLAKRALPNSLAEDIVTDIFKLTLRLR